jgi:hypothetical protein
MLLLSRRFDQPRPRRPLAISAFSRPRFAGTPPHRVLGDRCRTRRDLSACRRRPTTSPHCDRRSGGGDDWLGGVLHCAARFHLSEYRPVIPGHAGEHDADGEAVLNGRATLFVEVGRGAGSTDW